VMKVDLDTRAAILTHLTECLPTFDPRWPPELCAAWLGSVAELVQAWQRYEVDVRVAYAQELTRRRRHGRTAWAIEQMRYALWRAHRRRG
jgi:hypothetical protein